MAVRLPDFASVGFGDPAATGRLPSYPESDPVAAGEAALGKGVQVAGRAAVDFAEEQAYRKGKLEEAYATVDAKDQISQLSLAAKNETDLEKVAQYRKQMRAAITGPAQRITDPARRELWTAGHLPLATVGEEVADQRGLDIWRGQYAGGMREKISNAGRRAAQTDDHAVHQAVAEDIAGLIDAGVGAGVIAPDKAPEMKRQAAEGIITGHADWLDSGGRADEALDFLQKNKTRLPPHVLEQYTRRLETQAEHQGGQALANHVRRPIQGLMTGGAIPQAIIGEAQQQNVDPATALATAQIESSMGRNLGSRGNIFQLGQSEWSTIGGGSMGEPETDIRNGVAWLGKTQSDLASKLGRQPDGWEVYLAHQQGVAGATKLLNNPDTPAGKLVSPENITANGGDPNAPASAFIAKWRSTFQRHAAGFSSGLTPPSGALSSGPDGAAPASPVAIGDSIAAQLIRNTDGAVAGAEYGTSARDDSTATVGHSPAAVLGTIGKTPAGNIQGRDVFLSTGISNDPSQLDLVSQQIAALKQRGARSVTVLGVGNAARVAGLNDQLATIANDNGAAFAGPLGKVQHDGIHSSDAKDLLRQAQGAMPQQPAAEKRAVPDLDQQLRDIESDPQASQKQKDIAAAIVARDFHRQKAATAAATRQELASVKQLVKDDEASIALTGTPVAQLTEERVRAALGPDAADEFAANRGTASRYFEQTHDFENLPQAEIDQRLDAMRPLPGQLGFARNLKAYDGAQKRAEDLAKLRTTDPAAAVSGLPDVREAAKGATLEKPETMAPLVKARMLAMERIGIPEENRIPITRAGAQLLWQPIGLATRGGDPREIKSALTAVVQQVQAGFGDQAQRALEAVLREGHADHETAGVAAAIVRKLARNEMPTPAEARTLDEAQKNDAARSAVEPMMTEPLSGVPMRALPAPATAGRRMPAPDAAAIEMLRQSPQSVAHFDGVYGPGAAAKVLKIAPPTARSGP